MQTRCFSKSPTTEKVFRIVLRDLMHVHPERRLNHNANDDGQIRVAHEKVVELIILNHQTERGSQQFVPQSTFRRHRLIVRLLAVERAQRRDVSFVRRTIRTEMLEYLFVGGSDVLPRHQSVVT